MPDKFTITKEEQELIESLRKNGVVIDHRTGTAYVGKDERLFTESEVRAILVQVFNSRSHFELSGGLPGMLIQPGDVEQISKLHGIVLDPA